ncbi:MAG: hypothetical protein LBQ12_08720 [Deltaproteobacteria bacterium]|jgi:hypothetical protein|nr:hypothetical protein [Deltaproteobacteria bacterium]
MKRVSLPLIASAFTAALLFAAAAEPVSGQERHSLWSKTMYFDYGGEFAAAAPTSDGGAVLAGSGTSPGAAEIKPYRYDMHDALVVKIAPDGSTEWQTLMGGSSLDYALAVAQASDGGYLVGGLTRSEDGDFPGRPNGVDVPWVAKLTGEGKKIWARTLLGTSAEQSWVKAVGELPGGGIVAVGQGNGFVTGEGCMPKPGVAFWRLSDDGFAVTLNCPELDVDLTSWEQGAAVLPDGGAVAGFGYGGSFGVVRLNPDGGAAWKADTGKGIIRAFAPAPDGGVYGGGESPDGKPRIFSFGRDGNSLFDVSYLGVPWGSVFALSPHEDGFFAVGKASGTAAGGLDMVIVKGNSKGETLWAVTAGGSGDDVGLSAATLRDGSFIAGGSTYSWDGFLVNRKKKPGTPHEGDDAWAVKFNK